MRFLADENFRADVAAYLRSRGHLVVSVAGGASDDAVARLSRKKQLVILTHDRDFASTLLFPPRQYAGIIVLRVHPPSYNRCCVVLGSFLTLIFLKSSADVSPRVYRAPKSS